MLRVVAGKYRGRKLDQPNKAITRPTMDRVKESIFNVIQFQISQTLVLDLFAGSGSLGIEALSRGAMKVIAVDKSPEAIKILTQNVEKLAINNIEIVKQEVLSFLKSASGKKFDFIFLDPPFKEYKLYNQVLQAICEAKILKRLGLIILETNAPKQIQIPEELIIQKQKKYGVSNVMFLANNI